MARKIHLSIPKPCHENWNAMTQVEKGKFCGSCQKQVIDFSTMSDRQIAQFFIRPMKSSVCGRFMNDQLEKDFEVPKKRIPWIKYFFQVLIPAFLISKASSQRPLQGKVVPAFRDTTRLGDKDCRPTMGIVAPDIKPETNVDTIIVTKSVEKTISGIVINEKDEPVPFAMIRAGRKMNIFFADEKGKFQWKLTSADEKLLYVTSAGFKPFEQTFNDNEGMITIRLESNGEVIDFSSSAQTYIMGEITPGICVKDSSNNTDTSFIEPTDLIIQRDIEIPADKNQFYIYPNPALSGSNLSVGVHMLEDGYYNYQFLTIGGEIVFQKEIWIDHAARMLGLELPVLKPGSYLFVLNSKKSGKKYSEKIIVQ